MRDRLSELGTSTIVALITFTDPDSLEGYQRINHLPFPILIDTDRSTYHAYGLGRGSIRRVWGWRAARRYIEVIAKSGIAALRKPTEDTLQLGGDFIVAPDGTLTWGFWGSGPDDRPSVNDLANAVRKITT